MTRKGFLWALGVVLVANGFVLAGVAYNRSGTPNARLVLSARELPAAWRDYGNNRENTGISLSLAWQQSEPAVLTRSKLESLGFRLPRTKEERGSPRYKHLLDRKAYAVFEFNGEAWAALLKEKQAHLAKSLVEAKSDNERKNFQKSYDRFEKTASRLVLVDAGRDPTALRARYADGGKYLIAKVQVSVYPYFHDSADRSEQYDVQSRLVILPGTIYVPRQFHALIESSDKRWRGWAFNPENAEVPGYQVTLAYGQRYEPWVEGVVGAVR